MTPGGPAAPSVSTTADSATLPSAVELRCVLTALRILEGCLKCDGTGLLSPVNEVTGMEFFELELGHRFSIEKYFVFALIWGVGGGLSQQGARGWCSVSALACVLCCCAHPSIPLHSCAAPGKARFSERMRMTFPQIPVPGLVSLFDVAPCPLAVASKLHLAERIDKPEWADSAVNKPQCLAEFVTWAVVFRRSACGVGDRWFVDARLEGAGSNADVTMPEAVVHLLSPSVNGLRDDTRFEGRVKKELVLPASAASPNLQTLYTPSDKNIALTFIGLRVLLGSTYDVPALAAQQALLYTGQAGCGKTVLAKVLLATLASTVGAGNNNGGLVAYTGADGLAAERASSFRPSQSEFDRVEERTLFAAAPGPQDASLHAAWPQVGMHLRHSRLLQRACEAFGVCLSQYHVNMAALSKSGSGSRFLSGVAAGATQGVTWVQSPRLHRFSRSPTGASPQQLVKLDPYASPSSPSPTAGLASPASVYVPNISGDWEGLSPRKNVPASRRGSGNHLPSFARVLVVQ